MKDNEKIIYELLKLKNISYKKYRKILSKYPKQENKIFSKSELLFVYRGLVDKRKLKRDLLIERFLITKPTRTISGVVPVTVLTKPYECPGKCIFCPTKIDQPKSYLSSEPGAMRAKMLNFDPYIQTRVRIQALKNIGHNTDKVELIILGGTWSYYPRKYQVWFIKECFRALNGLEDQSDKNDKSYKQDINLLEDLLLEEQKQNETEKHRCIGLVIETRPDYVDDNEVKWLRFLGVTKVQLGVQTLDDNLLKLNKRGHIVNDSKTAIKLLRLAGFKLHLHWMMNLYGSTPKKDLLDFKRLFKDKSIRPDELKVYPCLLLEDTELYELYKKGKYKPYTELELLELLIKCKQIIQKYCRISRLFRDIPSFEIVSGVKKTNFREIVQREMENRGLKCKCIRCREIRNVKFKIKNVRLETVEYETDVSVEHFLNYVTGDDKIVGFLRLSLPIKKYADSHFIHELKNSALIREVHVYGISKTLQSNNHSKNSGQHRGLGTSLIKKAEEIVKSAGFCKIAVISAIGTRKYYSRMGYRLGRLYMSKNLNL